VNRPDIRNRIFKRSVLESSGYTRSCTFPFTFEGKVYNPRGGKSWRTNPGGMKQLLERGRLFVLGSKLYYKLLYSDFPYTSLLNSWSDTVAGYSERKLYVVQTQPKVIQRCLLMTTDPGDLVLDPTCGSGTTTYVAEQWAGGGSPSTQAGSRLPSRGSDGIPILRRTRAAANAPTPRRRPTRHGPSLLTGSARLPTSP
jgi:hypothetical protein